jgi:acyl carrier protein
MAVLGRSDGEREQMAVQSDVFDALCKAIRRGTGTADAAIDRTTTAEDVRGWDSLAHTRIILSAEVELGVEVSLEATYRAITVGELEQLFLISLAQG